MIFTTYSHGSLDLADQLGVVLLSISLSWIFVHIIPGLIEYFNRVNVPRVGKNPHIIGVRRARADFVKNGKALTKEGYIRFKDSMFMIQTGDMERLVVSNRFVDELRKLPDSYLDSRMAVVERNLGWYNEVDIILKSTTHVDVCRTKLVQNLDKITDGQVEDLDYIFRRELGACFDSQVGDSKFHFYNATETILHIVNRAVAKSLVGKSLSHDETWLRTSLESTINTGMLCRKLQPYPSFLRSLISPLTAPRQKLRHNLNAAQELLSPVINSRRRHEENIDILQWLMDIYEGDDDVRQSGPFLTKQILFLATAATRSTASSIVNTLFDLLTYPQFQDTLRKEIGESVSKAGSWNLASVQDMKRLDSFIKESQRLNHHILLNFNRKVRRPITLSNGMNIPAGTFLCTQGFWAARDPETFPGGEEFMPWRWVELREEAERQGKTTTPYLASSTSLDDLHWGYGRNACPGRFMAAAELKILVAWILWHFELCFPQGQSKRSESVFIDERIFPDPKQEIGFRVRKGIRMAVSDLHRNG